MRRLNLIAQGVAHVTGGLMVDSTVLRVQTSQPLMTYLTHVGREAPFNIFEALAGLVAICKAIVAAANDKEITVACARGYYHQLFRHLVSPRHNPRTHHIYLDLFSSPDFKGVFDLSGITVEDESPHFATPDFKAVSEVIEHKIREMKLERDRRELRKTVNKEQGKTWPLSIYETRVRYP